MKKHEEVIIINGEDKTDAVEKYSIIGDKCNISFKGKSKIYPYNKSNVNIIHCEERPDIDIKLYRVTAKNCLLKDIETILYSDKYIKIYSSNGKQDTYSFNDVKFELYCIANPNNKHIIDYFTELSAGISLKNDTGDAILTKQFNEIKHIGENSLLSKFIEKEPINLNSDHFPIEIYPFGLNSSQKTAVSKALSTNISVIEGPPGTGKTQTILNIIANIVLQKKTVAVVSGNNSATANILEKLDKNGLGFICASLGSKNNKDKFLEAQNSAYPYIDNWQLPPEKIVAIKESIKHITKELDEMLNIRNDIAIRRRFLSELEQEKKYFDDYFLSKFQQAITKTSLMKLNAERILQLWLECESFEEIAKKPNLLFKLKCSLLYGVEKLKFYNRPASEIIPIFQDLYYKISKKELELQLTELEKLLQEYSFEVKMHQLTEQSMQLFKATLAHRYSFKEPRRVFTTWNLRYDATDFTDEYPVVLSTTYSIQTSLAKGYMFDYIIVDEASQVDLLTGVLALASGRNAIIVGDLKQLPNVITNDNKSFADNINSKYNVQNCFDFCKNSLLSSIIDALPDAPRTMLREHYRCHPKIIEFCNKKFYNDQLIVMTDDNGEKDVLGVYYTRDGNHARGRTNQRQIDVIKKEVLPELNISSDTVGIVTPYRAQANKITNLELEADTVHKYQGREKENIIISTVDNQIGDFADNPQMLNVAVSRAVKRLRVVISSDEYNKQTNTGDLVKYIEYQKFLVVKSEVYSVFDLLYKAYEVQRRKFLKHHKKVSEFDSENIMYVVIEKILTEEKFIKLDFIIHLPLSKIIRNMEKLSQEEKNYVLHRNTHVDFIIFNKMDKIPVLVVEVDGTAYHQEGSPQYTRDQLKDKILAKYNIPVLRLPTDGSGEENKLRNILATLT